MGPENLRTSRANILQKFLLRTGRAGRVGASNAAQGMCVTPRDHAHGTWGARSIPILFEQFHYELIMLEKLRPVSNFEHVKQFRHALDEFTHPRAIGEIMKEMIERKQQMILPQVRHQFFSIGAQTLEF